MNTPTLGFEIVSLTIETIDGKSGIDIRNIYDEINIFENIMMPCMSGNILIRDAIGLADRLNFDGSEYIRVNIIKDSKLLNADFQMSFNRRFVIYKVSNRSSITQNSERYILHFVSEEFLLSQQKKIRINFKGTHSDMVVSILKDYLGLQYTTPQIGSIQPSTGVYEWVSPNISPFEAIDYLTTRAISTDGLSDYVFWQSPIGYNFRPLSELMKENGFVNITFGAKNLPENSYDSNKSRYVSELYGARDLKIVSQFNHSENIRSGVYAGKFIGFDTLTRTIYNRKINYEDIYKLTSEHANKFSNNYKILNKEYNTSDQQYDSRITLYPFETPRANNQHLKSSNDSETTNYIDDTENYVLQRRLIFANLMQKRLKISMPGNFQYSVGMMLNLNVPKNNNIENLETGGDKTLNGKYILTSLRHVIRFDSHETLLEVATDSTNYGAN